MFEFSLKNIFYILFFIGFINLIRDFLYAIKIKNTINKAITHFSQLEKKIANNDPLIGEHLIFLNQNHQVLNDSGLNRLYFRNDPHQPMLSSILINFPQYLKPYCREELSYALYSLNSKSIEIDSNFNVLRYFFNFFNPFMYLKKSIPIILNSFYEIFPLKLPKFIQMFLEYLSIIFGLLASLKQFSPNLFIKLMQFINDIIKN